MGQKKREQKSEISPCILLRPDMVARDDGYEQTQRHEASCGGIHCPRFSVFSGLDVLQRRACGRLVHERQKCRFHGEK